MQPVTVAVVDPDPKMRACLRAALRAEGYRVVTVSSSLAALMVCASRAVDAVVVELELGSFSGAALAETLKSRFPGLVVIGLAANPPAQPPPGISRVMAKPLDAQQLLAAIREALQAPPRKQPGVQTAAPERSAQAGHG